jgi:hypothetical protein
MDGSSSEHPGMALRDYFAAAALPAIIERYYLQSSQLSGGSGGMRVNEESMAKLAYRWADAMIGARDPVE